MDSELVGQDRQVTVQGPLDLMRAIANHDYVKRIECVVDRSQSLSHEPAAAIFVKASHLAQRPSSKLRSPTDSLFTPAAWSIASYLPSK